jgi:serine/threonine protein kinase
MERLYCSRCLKAHRQSNLEHCPRTACFARRPEGGWPTYQATDEIIDGRFRVLRMIGSGGAGLTYQCLDLDRAEVVALKLLHPDRRYGTLAQRMALEGELLELLEHPGIVPFRGIQTVGPGPAWLATTFVPGGTLGEQVGESGPFPLSAVAALAVQLAETLEYIHRSGVVHRDIKPSNLLLESNDLSRLKVRVADFGIARLFGNGCIPNGLQLTQAGLFVGTPEFAAPEQMRAERDLGPGVDKYALGAVLHFAATGESLFKCSSAADWILRRDNVWLPSQRPRLASRACAAERDLALTLDRLIDGLMAPEPSERLALESLLESLAPHSPPEFKARPKVSTTLCEVPEPEQMQAMARLWSAKSSLDPTPSIEPLDVVTRAGEFLPELLRDGWTTDLAEPEYLGETVGPTSGISVGSARQQPTEIAAAPVEVDWLPRAIRRRRAVLRVLAAVLVVSLGLNVQALGAETPFPSLATVRLEVSSWLQSSARLLMPTEPLSVHEEPVGAVFASTTKSVRNSIEVAPPSPPKVQAPRNPSAHPAAVVASSLSGGLTRPASPSVRIAEAKAPRKIAPKVVVGSDDVWGVKAYLARNIGDALAYDSEDEAVLERLFGDN